ncbi:MAG: hypothetical protein A2682_00705 [Candidatus Terrybacteria bacterium RIFCSPHIGHO2_01_FULL_58_15]|uniref:Proline--tRNA ligase n=1 Tax=Terrybacteria sp. (strain RIFCSPHIGHO2_01_FULL_58_15) TaxID=1802363 RepID=A0A1G2PLT3_TERXR|nr:MAG: hypothetical protein A2682_00705 [Candidatus Terrybacteria bacterium RIFCSPHIGHO2_01_FULL_58_15]
MVRQSELFLPLRREDPRGEEFANAKLLLRGGYIDKLSSGVFTMLPLGFMVLRRIEQIVREGMERLHAQEFSMPALQTPAIWEETGRWATLPPEMFQFSDRSDRPVGLAMTHEEVIFDLVRRTVRSAHELPISLYQFQTKFRDEPRPKSGLIRGREFLMKDLYSFHASPEDLETYYRAVMDEYRTIFAQCGLEAIVVEASGGIFTKNPSHEFQVIASSGEDRIILCERGDFAQNSEIASAASPCPKCGGALREERSVEVGNTFRFYDKYANDMRGYVQGASGEKLPILLASYGIGIGRLMATIVEARHDEKGIVWPDRVAPFAVHLLVLGSHEGLFREAERLGNALQDKGIAVLYDDRVNVSAGEKLATADLLGMPQRVVVSSKTFASGKAELKRRDESEARLVATQEIIEIILLTTNTNHTNIRIAPSV